MIGNKTVKIKANSPLKQPGFMTVRAVSIK